MIVVIKNYDDWVIHTSVEKFLKYVENYVTIDDKYKLVLFFMMNSVGVKNMIEERKNSAN